MHSICVDCGTQFAETSKPPSTCPICEDERQYVGLDGQQWTTLDELRQEHRTKVEHEETLLSSFSIEPHFAIGQRAFLLRTGEGNILWDCISLLDEEAIGVVKKSGGLHAIAISHPHYYTTMVEWSRAFENAPVFIHKDDATWIMRPDPSICLWDGDTHGILGGLTLIRCGGHFAGATVLHWPQGAEGQGSLLTGDTIQVVPDRRWVSFMYSYPNYVPLSCGAVERIVSCVEPFSFERIYGAFPKMTVMQDGKAALRRSAERYLKAIAGHDRPE